MTICILFLTILLLFLYSIAPRFRYRKTVLSFSKYAFAHRGYWDMEMNIPENSLPSFQLAVEHGFGIELDLHLTKDGKIVVFHDDFLTRMCGVDFSVENTTYDVLSQYQLAGTSEKIPLFSEVLALVKGKVPLLIELKLPSSNTALCSLVQKELEHYHGSYLIQSFNSLGLLWFRKYAPHILRGQLSANLTKTEPTIPFIACFAVKYLLSNVVTRPDFISYKLKDEKNISLILHKYLLNTPIAVWTLHTETEISYAKAKYSIPIFEKS
ncbi:glycerophosphodiester phosphodiesterase family protein [Faecalimonas sp.]